MLENHEIKYAIEVKLTCIDKHGCMDLISKLSFATKNNLITKINKNLTFKNYLDIQPEYLEYYTKQFDFKDLNKTIKTKAELSQIETNLINTNFNIGEKILKYEIKVRHLLHEEKKKWTNSNKNSNPTSKEPSI